MVALIARYDAKALGLVGFQIVLPDQLDGGFSSFGTAACEVDAAPIVEVLRRNGEEAGGKFFRRSRMKLRGMGESELRGLLGHGFANFPQAVTDADDGGLAGGVEKPAVIGGDDPTAFATNGYGKLSFEISGKKTAAGGRGHKNLRQRNCSRVRCAGRCVRRGKVCYARAEIQGECVDAPPKKLVRSIGRWSLVALMVNSIIGAGIFGLPALLAARLGGYTPLASLLAGAGILIVAACIAELSSRFEETGGLYLYGRAAFGRFAGILVGWMIWLTRIAAPAAAANLFAVFAAQFFPAVEGRSRQILVMGALLGHLAILNYLGVKTGKVVSNIFTVIKVGMLGAFIVSGLVALHVHPELQVPLVFQPASWNNWSAVLLLLVFAYGGFEGALIVGGESSDPRRDMPMALLAALVLQCFIYTGVFYVVLSTLPGAGASTRPLADAAQRFLGGWGAAAIGIAGLVSTYGYLSANLLHSPRIAFALAERGDFPGWLARVHPRFRTPHVSIFLYASLLFVFSVLGDFQWNATLSAASRLVVYGAVALALPVLRGKYGKAPFSLRAAPVFWVTSLALAVLLLTKMGKGEAIVVGGTTCIALVNWRLVRRTDRSSGQFGG